MINLVYRKPLFGVGINDADYLTTVSERRNGKKIILWRCPYYVKWKAIVERAFSEKFKARYPTYLDVTLYEPWIKFSNFKAWMELQYWEENLHLDKDILLSGNRVYGPDTCAFIPGWLNTLLATHANIGTPLPLGVKKERKNNNRPFSASVKIDSSKGSAFIGTYPTALEAHAAWQLAKADVIEERILRYMLEPCYRQDVANAIYLRAEMLRDDHANHRETFYL